MDYKPRILFYFLHLLGVGHVHRAKRLIDGFARHGFAVDIIYGGQQLDGIQFAAENIYYLPPIRAADNTYATYLDANDQPLDKHFLLQRAEQIGRIFAGLNPDIILTEAFPFGRRMVRFEMETLLEAAHSRQPKPLIVSSVRDILQERKKPGKLEETRDWIERYFDTVLVHSDPSVISLDATYPLAHEITEKLLYTGFVIPPSSEEEVKDSFDVVVSAGGGAFGGDLIETAMAATHKRPDWTWCISTGPNLGKDQFEKLAEKCPTHVSLTRNIPNLAGQMKRARISISQCGYNTAMDALAAHRDSQCRAVFVPYDTEGQSEQLRRAELLQEGGYAICLPQSQLTEQGLLAACDQATMLERVDHEVDFDGVDNSARLLLSLLEKK